MLRVIPVADLPKENAPKKERAREADQRAAARSEALGRSRVQLEAAEAEEARRQRELLQGRVQALEVRVQQL